LKSLRESVVTSGLDWTRGSERSEEMQQAESQLSESDEPDQLGERGARRNSSSLTNVVGEVSCQSNSSFQIGGDQQRRASYDTTLAPEPRAEPPPAPVGAEPASLIPLIGRRLTETAETIMLGMQARIASRATERSRAQRARQRRQERRQEQKAAKTLSAILLASAPSCWRSSSLGRRITYLPSCKRSAPTAYTSTSTSSVSCYYILSEKILLFLQYLRQLNTFRHGYDEKSSASTFRYFIL